MLCVSRVRGGGLSTPEGSPCSVCVCVRIFNTQLSICTNLRWFISTHTEIENKCRGSYNSSISLLLPWGERRTSLFLLPPCSTDFLVLTPVLAALSRQWSSFFHCLGFVLLWWDEWPHRAVSGASQPAVPRQQGREWEGDAGDEGTGQQMLPGTCSPILQDLSSHPLLSSQGASTVANAIVLWNGLKN